MISHLSGFLIAIGVVTLPILIMGGNSSIFLSLEGLLIVVFGTVAIALIAYPFRHIKHLLFVIKVILRKEPEEGPEIAKQIIELSLNTRGERALLESELPKIKNLFLKDGVSLIIDKTEENLESFLMERIQTKKTEDEFIINMIKKLGSFPPALGLLATVLSLVHLLQNMGSGPDGMASLGPTMAIGLVGTLYGIVMSNLLFAPIAENLAHKSNQEIKNRKIALVGLLLLAERKGAAMVQDGVNSVLRPEQRVNVIGSAK